MILVADVGNTNTKFALYPPGADEVDAVWRVSTSRERTPDEWGALLASLFAAAGRRPETVKAIALASVVPVATRWLVAACRALFGAEPVVLAGDGALGIPVRTDNPAETGVDRVVNALAAARAYGTPTIVVDCGTATKFDAVAADGSFLGGAIGPGLGPALDALAGRAARLYAVELVAPPAAIGRNTVEAIQSGVVLGYLALCDGMIRRIREELGEARVIATGGAGAILAEHLPIVERYDPMLTFAGILGAYRHLTRPT